MVNLSVKLMSFGDAEIRELKRETNHITKLNKNNIYRKLIMELQKTTDDLSYLKGALHDRLMWFHRKKFNNVSNLK